jgi:LacI family transcriptional regulator
MSRSRPASNQRHAQGQVRWPRIAVLVDHTDPGGQAKMAGVARYASLFGPWTLHTQPRGGFAPLSPRRTFDGDGMIVHATHGTVARYRKASIPLINVGSIVRDAGLPAVLPDNHAVGRIAGEHLLERGFVHLGYCGFHGHGYSDERLEGFCEAAGARKIIPVAYAQTERDHPNQGTYDFYRLELTNIGAWLNELHNPVGVLAANDMRARQVLDACRLAGLAVPEQVAVVGVDDDQLLCDTAVPPLSSVAIPFEQIGYEAAKILDQLMHGKRPPPDPLRIGPTGVVTRQSTDILAIEDRDLADALRYMREHATQGATVEDVLDEVPISRRSLERRTRQTIGRTPQGELTRLRVAHAKRLLSQTDLTMPHVAEQAGFSSAERLSVVFKRETSLTPSSYRRQFRLH